MSNEIDRDDFSEEELLIVDAFQTLVNRHKARAVNRRSDLSYQLAIESLDLIQKIRNGKMVTLCRFEDIDKTLRKAQSPIHLVAVPIEKHDKNPNIFAADFQRFGETHLPYFITTLYDPDPASALREIERINETSSFEDNQYLLGGSGYPYLSE